MYKTLLFQKGIKFLKTKFKFASLLLFLNIATTISAQKLIDEDFTGGLPAGWTNTIIQGAVNWKYQSSPVFSSTSGGQYIVFDDFVLGAGVSPNEAAITTKSLNCTGRLAVYLSFEHYWYAVEFTHGYVEVSNDGGTVWTTVADFMSTVEGDLLAPKYEFFDISAQAANQANVKVRFRYTDGFQAGRYWYIDDVKVYTEPDMAVTAMTAPSYLTCGNSYSNAENITVRVQNYGFTPESNVDVTLEITGAITYSVTETIPGPIAGESFVDYTFSAPVDMSADGLYHFNVYTSHPTEKYPANDHYYTARQQLISTLPYSEDFNISNAAWETGGTNNSWAYGQFTDMGGTADGNCWSTNLTGSYNNGEASWIKSPAMDMTNYPDPILEFDMKHTFESCCDRVYAQFSKDGTNWTTVATITGTSSNAWIHYTYTLNLQQCVTTCLYIRFYFTSDGSVVNPGVSVDNIQLNANPMTYDSKIIDLHFNNKCTFSANESIGISVTNLNSNYLCNVPVTLEITHPSLPTQIINGTVAGPITQNQRVNYTFPTNADLSGTATGDYTLLAYTDLTTDNDRTNDSLRRSVLTVINTFPYSENFDTSPASWVSNGNARHYWEVAPFTGMGGNTGYGKSWITNPLGAYLNSDDSYVMSPVFDFSAITCPYIDFEMKFNTENCCDYASIYSSINGGGSWQLIGVAGDPNWFNSGTTWRSASTTWKLMQHSLTSLAGQSCVMIKITFHSDGSSVSDGIAFDNVRVFDNLEDVGVSAIVNPTGSMCENTATEPVTVSIRNYGCAPVTNIPVKLEVTGAIPAVLTEVANITINPSTTVNYTFTGTIDKSVVGTYNLKAYTEYNPNDLNHSNDTTVKIVQTLIPGVSSLPYSEDFNADDGQWVSGGTNNSWGYGTFTDLGGTAFAGAWSMNPTGNYNNGEASWVMSPTFDLTSSPDPIVSFDYKAAFESCCDRPYLQWSKNGGASWNTVLQLNQNTANNWVHWQDTIPLNECYPSCVIFRFYATSDGSVVSAGLAVDNFEVIENANVNNAAVIDLHFNDKCTFGAAETIAISVFNVNSNAICNIPVVCEILHPTLGLQTITGIVPGPIASGARGNYTFPATANWLNTATGPYQLTGYVDFADDTDRSDDSIHRTVQDTIKIYPYSENFDSGPGSWVSFGGGTNYTWELNTFTQMGGNTGFGDSWVTNPRGNYNNSESSWVMSPMLDFSALNCPYIEFDIKYATEACCDWVRMDISTNGGASWTPLGTATDPSWTVSGNTWRGTSSNLWKHVGHSLSTYANQSCVLIRVLFGSDGSSVSTGIAFDNVLIENRDPNVGVTALTEPIANVEYCRRRPAETVKVTVFNYGCSSISNIPIHLDMTGPFTATFDEVVPGPIASGASYTYTFTGKVNMESAGIYSYVIYTNYPTESYRANDTLKTTVNQLVYQTPIVNTFPYLEDFELGQGGWIKHPGSSANSTWDFGQFTDMTGVQGYGNSWSTQLTGSYNNSESGYVMSPIFDFTTVSCPYIEFDMKYQTESCCDWSTVQYSTNGGSSWNYIGSSADPSWYNSGTAWRADGGTNWHHFSHGVYSLGGQSCVLFRFWFQSDGSVVNPGIAFDNFKVTNHDIDVAATALVSPVSNSELCERRDNDQVTITVYNFGCTPISNIPVSYRVTGAGTASYDEIMPGPINSGASANYTFTGRVDMTTIGTYAFKIFTGAVGDVEHSNDTILRNVVVTNYLQVVNTFPYKESFEAGAGDWQSGGSNNSWGLGTFASFGGNTGYGKSWKTNLSGNYNNSENSWVMSPIFDLTGITCAYIGFDYKYLTENCCDGITFEYSTNGGAGWAPLGTAGDFLNWYNSGTTWRGDPGSTAWRHAEHSISGLAGNSCVIFRVRLASDGSAVYSGFAFDNFQLRTPEVDAAIGNFVSCWGSKYPMELTVTNMNNGANRYCTPTGNITDIDIIYTINGGAPISQNYSGLSIAPGASSKITLDSLTIQNSSDIFKIWLTNTNGVPELVNYNDTIFPSGSLMPNCNDHCSNAIDLVEATTTASQTTNATVDLSEDPSYSACIGGTPVTKENTVWYKFSTDCTGGNVDLAFTNTSCLPSPTGIQVSVDRYDGPSECIPTSYTNVYCAAPGDQSDIVWNGANLPARTTYYITVDGVGGNSCDFNIQLTGNVAFDPSKSLSGSYQIDPTNVNYPNFTAAFDSLDMYGITGPVLFEVVDTTYYEQLEMGGICGTSPTDTIVFKSYCDDCARAKIQFNADDYSFPCGQDFETSLHFDGTNDYVLLSHESNFDFEKTNAMTIEAWVKTKATGSYRVIFSKMNNAAPYTGYEMGVLTDGRLHFYFISNWSGNALEESSTLTVNDGVWHHVAVTYDGSAGSAGLKFYIDGALAATTVDKNTLTGTVLNNYTPTIGCRQTTVNMFLGEIDELRVWKEERNSVDIQDNMCITISGTEPNLVAYYQMENGSGSSALSDMTPNGNNGTLTNMDITNDWYMSNIAKSNNLNTALDFDGVNDYVLFNNTTAYDIPTGTIESWIKTPNAGASYRGIIIKQMAYGLFLTDNVLTAYDWSGPGAQSTGINLADNKWHHVAMSFSSGVANGTKIYVDGNLVKTFTYTISNQNEELVLGQGNDLTPSQNFTGLIDEVRVWNDIRTKQEIQDNMYSNLVGNEANLLGYYTMEDGTGSSTLTDKTVNGYNGTLTLMDPATDWVGSGVPVNCTQGNVSGSYNNYTMKLNESKHITFKRIDFEALDPAKSLVINLLNSENLRFDDCIITGDLTNSDTDINRTLVYSTNTKATADSSNIFINSEFNGGSYGLYLDNAFSSKGTSINSNTFTNQSFKSISLLNEESPQIIGNSILTNSALNVFEGISLTDITTSLSVQNNKITAVSADGNGIYINHATAGAGTEGSIINNMISFGTPDADASYGINIENGTTYQNLYFNSVNMLSNTGSAFNVTGADFLNIRNNIFASSSGTAYTIAASTNETRDYNDVFPDDAGKGTNSISTDPLYISSTDLHTEAAALDNAGVAIAGITLDIDKETRGAVPFIGADEFIGINYWTGAVDTDWNLPGNWDKAQVPTIGTTAVIPVVTNYPETNSVGSKLAECRNLTIDLDAHLWVAPAHYLTVDKSFNQNGTFIIKSDATGTGSFIPKGSYTNTGTTKMELYLTTENWHFIGSPITNANGVFVHNQSTQYFYWWDETIKDRWLANDFVDWADGVTKKDIMGWTKKTNAMVPAEGYAYLHFKPTYVANFSGEFNNGNITTPLLPYTDQGGNATQDLFDGWCLISNPYPSTLSWSNPANVKTNVDNAIYVYDDDGTGNYNNYKYYVSGKSQSDYMSITANGMGSCFLAPGQAAFVRANQGGASSITFSNLAREHTSTPFYKTGEIHPDLLRLSVNLDGISDETVIRFVENSTSEYDGEFDALKRFSTSSKVPQILTTSKYAEFAISTLPEIYDNLVIPVKLVAPKAGKYTISATELNFDAGINVYLIDKYLSKRVNLNKDREYTFKSENQNYKDRFEIIFKLDKHLQEEQQEDVISGTGDVDYENVNIYSNNKDIFVKLIKVSGNENILLIQDVLGKKIIERNVTGDFTKIDMVQFASGTYFVKLITKNKTYDQKVIINR